MSLSWLPAAIALQSGLPSVSLCDYLLFLCPLAAQQRRADEALALLREAAAEAVRKHLAAQHWTETALIFDGHDYGPTPVPLIPGLLVASPMVAASKPALTDSSVFRLILNPIFNLVIFFITLWIAYLSLCSVAYVVKLVISLISWVTSSVFWIICSSVTWVVSVVVKIIVAAGSNVWSYLVEAKGIGKGWCKRVDLAKLTSIAVSFFVRPFASSLQSSVLILP
ncbi:unnamed protein product [Peniophora sp. CBMAI 1063]|nr:unnamed protein product [Peniophora sp. CBMAI 1063]